MYIIHVIEFIVIVVKNQISSGASFSITIISGLSTFLIFYFIIYF